MPESTDHPTNTSPEQTGERPPREDRGPREHRGPRGEHRGPRGEHRGGPRGGGDRPHHGGDDREGHGDDRGGRRPRRFHRGKVCQFCVDKTLYIDFKDLERLRNYVTDSGKILPRRITGNCASHQRMVTVSLKRARMMALLPYKNR